MQDHAGTHGVLLRHYRHARQQLRLELVGCDHRGEREHLLPVDIHVLRWHVQPAVVSEYLRPERRRHLHDQTLYFERA